MSLILKPGRWQRQPDRVARLDRTFPYAVNLVHATQFGASTLLDAVNPQKYKAQVADGTFDIVPFVGGRAIQTDGSNGKWYAPAVPYSAEFTWLGRVVLASTYSQSTYRSVAAHHTTKSVAGDWFLYRNTSSVFVVDIPWVLGTVLTATGASANGLDVSIALRRTGSAGAWTYRLYLNGRLNKESATAGNPSTSAQSLVLGGFFSTASNSADNKHLYSYYYNKALPDGLIAEIAQNPWQIFEPDLARSFHFISAAAGAQPIARPLTHSFAVNRAANY